MDDEYERLFESILRLSNKVDELLCEIKPDPKLRENRGPTKGPTLRRCSSEEKGA